MRHLILGYGEVGKGLHKIVGKSADVYDIDGIDTREQAAYDMIHACFPYSWKFKIMINHVKSSYPESIIVVHSSVPIGTCDGLGVVHSPIRGVHPDIDKGIRTFVKYFGGRNARKAAKIFKAYGIKTKVFDEAKTTEAIKLWDTTQYGRLIMLEKEIHAWCEKNNIDFNAVYTQANKDYNEGYVKLKRPEVVRPYLKHVPGPIGGHCVLPNAKLLKKKI